MISPEVTEGNDRGEEVWHDSELTFDTIFTQAVAAGNTYLHQRYGVNLALTESDEIAVFFSTGGSERTPKGDFESYPILLDLHDAYFSMSDPTFPEELHICSLTGEGMNGKYTPEFAENCRRSVIDGIDDAFASHPGLITTLKKLHPAERAADFNPLESVQRLSNTMHDRIDATFNAPEMRALTTSEIKGVLEALLIGLPIQKSCKVFTEKLDSVTITATLVRVEIANGGKPKVIEYCITEDGLPAITVREYQLD